MADVHYALKEDRAPLALGGRDARPFLQGMVTNDVDRVAVDRAIYAGFLTPQGRFLHDLFIAPSMHDPNPAAFLLDGEAARLDDLKRRLQLYKLRADVVITDARETLVVAVLWGRDAPSAVELSSDPGAARRFGGGIVFVDPRLPALGLRALLPKEDVRAVLEKAGFTPRPLLDYQRRRIELGVPEGSPDLPVEKALLLENGFEELHGVDFKKGCYIGQEVTARMKYRALVKKRLLPVAIEGPPPAPGTPITLDGEEAGEMRTSLDGVGLALLKLDAFARSHADATPLIAADSVLRARKPDWAVF
ncbi:MAG TPA: folate-binding protein [Alphaproteobacteria bacterium]|nr:folate-binding protein [Alphaproteobacteria bacterium]